MDYKGQQLCEYIYSIITILFSVVSWFVGYFKGDFLYTFYGWAAGLAIALILCIPDWPMYNRNKVIWLDDIGRPNKSSSSSSSINNNTNNTNKSKAKKGVNKTKSESK
mmetsp:Transcript_5079/g.5558  ORF Transcript_5079/g.5558 Transcript_5079/m.5558 type:complete len:108 (-) Transcript_5079:2261-2584(-)|eukprot:gene14892-16575_t